MKFLRPFSFLAFATLSSCALYDAELLESATAGSGDGGSVSTGGTSTSGGGTGGTGTGGGDIGTGGSDPVGSGGDGTNGGTGGEPEGVGGTPGVPVIGLCEGLCLDHMNHPASGSSWKNPAGSPANIGFNWGTYDDTKGSWTSPASAAMFMSPRADHPNSAGATEKELRITGTGFSDFGIGVYVKLNSSGAAVPVNLKAPIAYSGVKFWAKLNGDGFDVFSVALEDSVSTTGSTHPKSVAQFLTTEWQLFTLSFEDFSPAVLADQVIAVHFVMDPATDPYNIDFSIDDLYFYE